MEYEMRVIAFNMSLANNGLLLCILLFHFVLNICKIERYCENENPNTFSKEITIDISILSKSVMMNRIVKLKKRRFKGTMLQVGDF